jgi:hypothetical protein
MGLQSHTDGMDDHPRVTARPFCARGCNVRHCAACREHPDLPVSTTPCVSGQCAGQARRVNLRLTSDPARSLLLPSMRAQLGTGLLKELARIN